MSATLQASELVEGARSRRGIHAHARREGDLGVQPLTGWQFNLVLAIPLSEGGLRYGQAKERRTAEKAVDAQFEASLRQARSEVRTAFQQVTHADAALQAAREAAKLATEALESANASYHAGATTNLDLLAARGSFPAP